MATVDCRDGLPGWLPGRLKSARTGIFSAEETEKHDPQYIKLMRGLLARGDHSINMESHWCCDWALSNNNPDSINSEIPKMLGTDKTIKKLQVMPSLFQDKSADHHPVLVCRATVEDNQTKALTPAVILLTIMAKPWPNAPRKIAHDGKPQQPKLRHWDHDGMRTRTFRMGARDAEGLVLCMEDGPAPPMAFWDLKPEEKEKVNEDESIEPAVGVKKQA